MSKDVRNIHPHKEAIAMRFLFGRRYAAQRMGCMDFYDTLTDQDKALCVDLVDEIERAEWRASGTSRRAKDKLNE